MAQRRSRKQPAQRKNGSLPTELRIRLNLDLEQHREIAAWWVQHKGQASSVARDAIYVRLTGRDPVTGRPVSAGGLPLVPAADVDAGAAPHQEDPAGDAPRDRERDVDPATAALLNAFGDL
jgi:hypothetical protein